MKYLKHTLTILLVMLMVLSIVPAQMFAEGDAGVDETVVNTEGTLYDKSGSETAENGEDPDETGDSGDTDDPDDPDQPSGEDMEDPDSYDPNPSAPEGYSLVTITGIRQVEGKGTHIASFSDGYGEGICCYHNRKYAGVGQKGWMRRVEPGEAHYSDIRKVMYWGVYMKNGNLTLANSFSIHIMLSYWRNGNKSLSSNIKEGTSRFNTAKKYSKTLTDKDEPPASFQIYEWVGTGSASKSQVLITYNNGCYVCLQKKPLNSDIDYLNTAPNNYSLEGAVYVLYTDAACTVRATDINGNDFQLTTDKSGKTDVVAVAPSQYWAKEVTASRGYMLDTVVRTVTVNTSNTRDVPAVINSSEPPAKAIPIELRKIDKTGKYGWRKLLGAEYTLKYYDADPETTDVSGQIPKRSWTFKTVRKTDENGKDYAGISFADDNILSGDDFYIDKGKRVMPCGVFTIEETKAPAGLSRNTSVYYCMVYQPGNGSEAKTKTNTTNEESMGIVVGSDADAENAEIPQGVEIVINKKDASGKADGKSLAGAEYDVYYDDDDLSSPELVGTIVTDENGYGVLSERRAGRPELIGEKLDPGSYTVKETKAAPGFVIDRYKYKNGRTSEAEPGNEDVICEYSENGTTVKKTITGRYSEGQHLFRARAESLNTDMFSFTVTSEDEPTRTYISKRDITDGSEVPGAKLQVISMNEGNEGAIVEEWVSTDEEHLIYALPPGKYKLREITAPYGYDVAEDAVFEIKANVIEHHAEMLNKPLVITTSAASAENAAHHGHASESEIITDRVKISGLYAGRTYKVSGSLVDKATGENLKDKNGNEVISEKEFIAEAETAELDLSFTVDSSSFTKDSSSVGFEKLYRTSAVYEGEQPSGTDEGFLQVELAKHEDLNCASQIIRYGGIVSTMALDGKSRSKGIKAGRSVMIKDYVEYKGLSSEETYTLEAEVYDKTASATTGIKTVSEFKPAKDNGTTIVEIKLNTSKLKDHDLVVFETLYVNGKMIDVHADPNDGNQTVHVMDTTGSAAGPETGDNRYLLGWIGIMTVTSIMLTLIVLKRLTLR